MKPGDEVAGYVLQGLLGTGGFGEVWLASQRDLKRQVALKVMRGDPTGERSKDHDQRFRREMQIQASLVHPNLVGVFDGGVHQGELYLVMEYVAGATLRRVLQEKGAYREHHAVALVAALASATAYLHEKEILHRDLKPENVLVDSTGNPKITDFGLSRASGNTILTKTNQLVGTPNYFAPELMEGQENSPASDVYALGVIAYEVLSGKIPYTSTSFQTLAREILTGTRIPLTTFVPNVSPEVKQLVESCLSLEPSKRPTARELEQGMLDLVDVTRGRRGPKSGAMSMPSGRHLARSPVSQRIVVTPSPTTIPVWRRHLPGLVAAALLPLVAAGAFVFMRGERPAPVTGPAASAGASGAPVETSQSRRAVVLEKYCEQLKAQPTLVHLIPPGETKRVRDLFLRHAAELLSPGKKFDQALFGVFVMIPREARSPARLTVTSGTSDPATKLVLNGKALSGKDGVWMVDPRLFRNGLNLLEFEDVKEPRSLRLGLADLGEPSCAPAHRPFPVLPEIVATKFYQIDKETNGIRNVTGITQVEALMKEHGEHGLLVDWTGHARLMVARGRMHLSSAGGVRVMADVLSGSEARLDTTEPDELTLARSVLGAHHNVLTSPATSTSWILMGRVVNLAGLKAEGMQCIRYACLLQPDHHHPWVQPFRLIDDTLLASQASREDIRVAMEAINIARELDDDPFYMRATARLEELFAGKK